MRLVGLTAILCASFVSRVGAQAEEAWLILPAEVGDGASSTTSTASRLRIELTKRGIDLWSFTDGAARFEQVGSAPPPVVDEQTISEWLEGSDGVLESLVRGQPKEALAQLQGGDLLSDAYAEVLNRISQSAQKLLDTCLLGVRARLETGSESEAASMAERCRRLSVRGEPSPRMHPPPVLQLLGDVDADRTRSAGTLAVDSEPAGCGVRINGLMVANTPAVIDGLLPGQYGVQVECDATRPGRIHRAEVDARVTELVVDTRFDDAIVSRPGLKLRYATSSERSTNLSADAMTVLAAVPAGVVVTLVPDGSVTQVIRMEGAPPGRKAAAQLKTSASGATREEIAAIAAALIDGDCLDLTRQPAIRSGCDGAPFVGDPAAAEVQHPNRRPRGQFISGLTLLGVGGASLLTGYVLTAPRARAAEDWVNARDTNAPSASSQEKWFNQGVAITVTASVGAGALTAAMPLVLPNRDKTPWWAWVSGGVGVGLAAFAIAYGVGADPEPAIGCSNLVEAPADARTCVKRGERIDAAVLTGVTAAPLITIPLVYLLRRDREVAPEVVASRRGAYVGVRVGF